MIAKIILLVAFFSAMIVIGLYCRKHSTDVQGFVLGSRNVGPWLTAFAYGTSYFSLWYSSAMQASLAGNTALLLLGSGSETH